MTTTTTTTAAAAQTPQQAWGGLQDDKDPANKSLRAEEGPLWKRVAFALAGLTASAALLFGAFRSYNEYGRSRSRTHHEWKHGSHFEDSRKHNHDHHVHHVHHQKGDASPSGDGEEAGWAYKSLQFRVDDVADIARRVPEAQAKGVVGGESAVISAWIYLEDDDDDDEDDHDSSDDEEHERNSEEEDAAKRAERRKQSEQSDPSSEARVIFSTGGLDPTECETYYSDVAEHNGSTGFEDVGPDEDVPAGMALYVVPSHGGQLKDRLILAYRTAKSGGKCRRLVSMGRHGEVEVDEWVHVAISVTPVEGGLHPGQEEVMKLYLDGHAVAQRREGMRLKPAPGDEKRTVLGRIAAAAGGSSSSSGSGSSSLELWGDMGMVGVWSLKPYDENEEPPEDYEDSSDDEYDPADYYVSPYDLIDELWEAEFDLEEVEDALEERRAVLEVLHADVEDWEVGSEDHDEHRHDDSEDEDHAAHGREDEDSEDHEHPAPSRASAHHRAATTKPSSRWQFGATKGSFHMDL
uniref:Uncharacterized protein n=2 Tax=Odontella aurita TaxID=265563 RepID=A0A7S4MPS3_9STRA